MFMFIKKNAMILCCFLMAIPLLALFTTDLKLNGFSAYVSAAIPIFLCVGSHFLLHKFMCSKSENSKDESKKKISQNSDDPLLLATSKKVKF